MKAQLVVTAEEERTGALLVRWEGPLWQEAIISRQFLRHVGTLPWKLRWVRDEWRRCARVYARADGWRVVTWAGWWLLARAREGCQRAFSGLFWLAWKAGFAVNEGEQMSWGHLFRALRQRRKR